MSERLFQNYKNNIVTVLQDKFNYKNVMQIPKIDKVVINMGVGEAVKDSKKIEIVQKELSLITGQFPIITKAKKS
jgi:large subunit ribosomal protein L5